MQAEEQKRRFKMPEKDSKPLIEEEPDFKTYAEYTQWKQDQKLKKRQQKEQMKEEKAEYKFKSKFHSQQQYEEPTETTSPYSTVKLPQPKTTRKAPEDMGVF